MLIFYLRSDMGEKLWNSINNRVHDIVAELQQPNHLEESTAHIRSIVGIILLLKHLKLNIHGSYFTSNRSAACDELIHSKFVTYFIRKIRFYKYGIKINWSWHSKLNQNVKLNNITMLPIDIDFTCISLLWYDSYL